MSDERTFPMALRTGNWGRSVMLPFHKPVTVTLAPEDEPELVVRFGSGLSAVPRNLTAADLDRVTVSEPGGRPLLLVDLARRTVERASADSMASARNWALLVEGQRGLLSLYSRGDVLPSAELLDELAARLQVSAPVD